MPESKRFPPPPTAPTYQADYQEEDRLVISQPPEGTTNPPPSTYWYQKGQVIVISAVAAPGYQLDNWVLDGAGNMNSISFVMNSPHNLTAIFELEPLLSVRVGNGGSILVASSEINGGTPVIVSGGTSQTFSVPTGTTIALTATPNTSFQFRDWTGLSIETTNPLSLRITANVPVMANFYSVSPTQSQNTQQSNTNTPTNVGGSQGPGISFNPFLDFNTTLLILGVGFLIIIAIVGIRLSRKGP